MPQLDLAHGLLSHSELFIGYDAQADSVLCSDWPRLGLPIPDRRDLRIGVSLAKVAATMVGYVERSRRRAVSDAVMAAWTTHGSVDIEFFGALPGQPQRRWRIVDVPGFKPSSARWIRVRDIDEARNREDQIDELSVAVENAMQGIAKLDTKGFFTDVRPAYAKMLGYADASELIGESWSATVPKADHAHGEAIYGEMLASGKASGLVRALRKDGTEFDKQLLLVKRQDRDGRFIGHFCFMRDVSRERALQRKLEHEAGHDPLTTLINRREFEERLSSAIKSARRNGGEHVVIYLDLDQFKVINDTLGHVAGDHLLTKLAGELSGVVRSRDTLARLGGDEFAILAEHCDVRNGLRVAEALRRTVSDFETYWEGIPLKVGASLGIARIGHDSHTASEVLKQADSACYIAKELGRNRAYVYGESDDEVNRRDEQMQWIARIHEALKSDGFAVFAQKIVHGDRRDSRYYEALIRLKVKDGNASPSVFLPAAEKYNVADKIDHWMVEQVFKLLADNPRWAASIEWISINLSGQTLGGEEFRGLVPALLERYRIDASKVCFEITETSAVSRLDAARDLISSFRALGFRFALDDFGAGVSSFGYLQQLDVDYIKIDGSIVRNIEHDEASAVMVEAIAKIANIRGMLCIAEFVASQEVARRLHEFGIRFMQGYFFDAPRPAEEVIQPLAGGKAKGRSLRLVS
ncbi:MAG: EAL domain-containing protein [Pseudomonadota bacterium]